MVISNASQYLTERDRLFPFKMLFLRAKVVRLLVVCAQAIDPIVLQCMI